VYQHNAQLGVAALLDCVNSDKNPGFVRILEVGGGTGATTKLLLQEFTDLNIHVQYTFTDVSPHFLAGARKQFMHFKDTSVSLDYTLFNIEEDPLSQDLPPANFDFILAFRVIHATRDIAETLSNLKILLRPGGILLFVEEFQGLDVISFPFGLLDGWWRFRDFRSSPIIDGQAWSRCLEKAGLKDFSVIEEQETAGGVLLGRAPESQLAPSRTKSPNFKSQTWLLFDDGTGLPKSLAKRLELYGREVIFVVQETDPPMFEVCSHPAGRANPFEGLFSSVQNNAIHVEGIIHFSTRLDVDVLKENGAGVEAKKVLPLTILNLCKSYLHFIRTTRKPPRFVGLTRGVHYAKDEDVGAGNPNNSSIWGVLTSFVNENPDLPVSVVDLDQDETPGADAELDLIISRLWSRDVEIFSRFWERKSFNYRLTHHPHLQPGLTMPSANERWTLFLPQSKAIADLQLESTANEKRRSVGDEEVEVEIRATGLNFKDLLMILRPDGFRVPPGQEDGFGLDISGIITSAGAKTKFQIGDEVMSFQSYGGFKSHVILPAVLVVPKPSQFTFVDAATLPCVFLTAHEGLVNVARINSADRALIHVATGGVGLACIQLANEAGATVYATAGSKRKRAYLHSLGIAHVYNSRNTNYGDEIMKDTEGAGVTIVMNSLTAPGYKEASLRICAEGATFVELGKVDVFTNDEVFEMRPDLNYALVDITAPSHAYIAQIWGAILPKFGKGTYKPLPSTMYPLTQLKSALNYFKAAKHIGKVVLKMPHFLPGQLGPGVWSQKIFNEGSTYLITGGLGGLGMQVANWMHSSGTENIVLVGRSPPTAPAQELIHSWNASGGNVKVFNLDVGDYDEVEILLKILQQDPSLPPLRGIFHAAGTLKDAVVPNQTEETFLAIFQPKVMGAWNLHQLTRTQSLDFFVTFSSMSGIVGLQGQSNHAAANRYLDSLMGYRRANGLPGLTINWGAWSEVSLDLNWDTPAQALIVSVVYRSVPLPK